MEVTDQKSDRAIRLTEPHRELIRSRLEQYLDREAPPSRVYLPMAHLFERILSCPKIDQGLLVSRRFSKKDESVRRFVFENKALDDTDVLIIQTFLVWEDWLDLSELNIEGLGPAYLVQRFLGFDDEAHTVVNEDLRQLSDFEGTFELVHEKPGTKISLSLHLDRSEKFLQVSERLEEHFESVPLWQKEKLGMIKKSVFRKGYAFFSTSDQLLHVFLRGHSINDRVSYIEAKTQEKTELSYFLRISVRVSTDYVEAGAYPMFALRPLESNSI